MLVSCGRLTSERSFFISLETKVFQNYQNVVRMIHFMDLIMCVGRSLDPVHLFPSVMVVQGDCSVGIFVAGDCFQPC